MNVDGLIHDDWGSEPGVMGACLQVWHALSSREDQPDHYTFDDLLHLTQAGDEAVVARALSYLATPRLRVLEISLMYETNGGFYELPEEEVGHYARGEPVIHPEFGEPIPESQIMICFTPGFALKNKGAA